MPGTNTDLIIEIHPILPNEHPKIMEFLMKYYYPEEILTISIEPKEPTEADIEFTAEALKDGFSLKAVLKRTSQEEYLHNELNKLKVQQDNNGLSEKLETKVDISENLKNGAVVDNSNNSSESEDVIVGVAISGCIEPDDAKIMLEDADSCDDGKWSTILRFLATLERDADVCKRYGAERGLHTHVMAVDQTYRGLGIGSLLLEAAARRARTAGFGVYSVDCTSAYSTRSALIAGLKPLRSVRYADYKNDKGEQVFVPPIDPELHHSVTTFVQNFDVPKIA